MNLIYGAHQRGYGFYHAPSQNFMLAIPKNGTESMRLITRSREAWREDNVFDLESVNRIIVLLRDPCARFLSALNMRIYTKNHNTFFINQLFDKCDLHFLEQYHYLYHIYDNYAEKVDFFYFNSNVFSEVNVYYNGIDLERMPRTNPSTKFILSVAKTTVQEMYSLDYDFMNTIEFKNRGSL